MNNFDIAIIGGGYIGCFTAQCLEKSGLNVALIAPPTKYDNRTTALLMPSITALKALGLWKTLEPHATPLRIMRLIDDTASLIRAPEVNFNSQEIEQEAFGYNVENNKLLESLKKLKNITLFQDVVTDYEAGCLTLTNTKITCKLAIAADGGRSFIREKAGIDCVKTELPQWALTLNFSHSRPHGGASTEFHTSEGPFTLVPMQGNRSSLVWVRRDKPNLTNLSEDIETQSKGILGKISELSEPSFFPLFSMQPKSLIAEKLALVGEAAHVLPPIGAQGMNLGFRDAAFIAQLCCDNFENPNLLEDYARLRRSDILLRSLAVDSLNHSLLSSFLPPNAFRALGIHALNALSPLKQIVMKTGLAPNVLPKIMIETMDEEGI